MSVSAEKLHGNRGAWHHVEISDDLFNFIVGKLANGTSLSQVCREGKQDFGEDFPNPASFLWWIEENEGYREEYARAMKVRADVHAEDIIDISDGAVDIGQARLRIDARRWHNEKMAPKKYGAKYTQDINTSVEVKHKVDFGSLSQAARDQLREVLTQQISGPVIEHEE